MVPAPEFGLDGEPGALQMFDHTLRLEEPEIKIDR
jgi:hypothetical protein